MVLGYLLRQFHILDEPFVDTLNSFNFKITLPVLLFRDIEACEEVLGRGTAGVLAVAGDEGYPYAVPLSYVYDAAHSAVYFHSALCGHKLYCTLEISQTLPLCGTGKGRA